MLRALASYNQVGVIYKTTKNENLQTKCKHTHHEHAPSNVRQLHILVQTETLALLQHATSTRTAAAATTTRTIQQTNLQESKQSIC